MFKSKYDLRGLTLGIISSALFVTACDLRDSDSSETDTEAGRASVEAMATDHAGKPQSGEGAQMSPRHPVVSERLPYAEVEDELVYGYFAFPSDMINPLPAIIVIHEWWGLNDNIRAMADRLAAEGYIVLAVDLFGGKTGATAVEARQLMLSVVDNPDPAAANLRQAYDFVNTTAGAPRIASLGWGFGGDWSLSTAMLFPEDLDAAVIYYGQVTNDEDKLRPIDTPILGLFGAEDKRISIESVEKFELALERLRKNYEVHIYSDAGHAFANPSARYYDADVAEDAWKRTLEFLGQNIDVDDDES
jgi:carboxymethylenebutenolidase